LRFVIWDLAQRAFCAIIYLMDASLPIPRGERIPEVNLGLPKHEYLNLVIYLQSPEIKKVKLSSGNILERPAVKTQIKDALFRINTSLPPERQIRPSELRFLIESLMQPEVSQTTVNRLFRFFQTYINLSQDSPSRPSVLQLTEWQRQMAQAQIESDPERQRETVQIPDYTSLEFQIKFIQTLKKNAEDSISHTQFWQNLTPSQQEEKRNVFEELAQSFSQDIISQREALGGDFDPHDPNFVWRSIDRACEENPEINEALPRNIRVELTRGMASKTKVEDCRKLADSQEKIMQTAVPHLARIKQNLTEQIVQEAKVSEKRARQIAAELTVKKPSVSRPTVKQVKKTISDSLSLSDLTNIYRQNGSPEKTASSLEPRVSLYYQALAGLEKYYQQRPWLKPPSLKAIALAKKLNLAPADTPLAEYLLQGLSPKEIQEKISGWAEKGLSAERIEELKEKLKGLKMPFSLRFSRIQIQLKLKINKTTDFISKFNPLNAGFYRHHPRLNLRLRFRHWRSKQWKKFVDSRKSAKWKHFYHHLPEKLRLSWWTGLPSRALRKGTGKLLIKAGGKLTKLGKEAFSGLLKNYLVREQLMF